jgi:hypothetical protein
MSPMFVSYIQIVLKINKPLLESPSDRFFIYPFFTQPKQTQTMIQAGCLAVAEPLDFIRWCVHLVYDVAKEDIPLALLIRGESGCGKNTFSHAIQEFLRRFGVDSEIVSASMFMTGPFDKTKLAGAHTTAQRMCSRSELNKVLMVCNTATEEKDLQHYLPVLEKRRVMHVILSAPSLESVCISARAAAETVRRQWRCMQECSVPVTTLRMPPRPALDINTMCTATYEEQCRQVAWQDAKVLVIPTREEGEIVEASAPKPAVWVVLEEGRVACVYGSKQAAELHVSEMAFNENMVISGPHTCLM